jgi:arsenate reductase
VAYRRIDLTKTPPSANDLREICRALGKTPREILRQKDPEYAALGLDSSRISDEKLLELMSKHPGLIQRPIVVKGKKAVVARPVEAIETLLG